MDYRPEVNLMPMIKLNKIVALLQKKLINMLNAALKMLKKAVKLL